MPGPTSVENILEAARTYVRGASAQHHSPCDRPPPNLLSRLVERGGTGDGRQWMVRATCVLWRGLAAALLLRAGVAGIAKGPKRENQHRENAPARGRCRRQLSGG